MLQLEDFQPETMEVPLKKGPLVVRGLNAADLSFLLSSRLPEIERIWTMFAEARASIFSRSSLDGMVMAMLQQAPGLVAEVISRAADQEGPKAVLGASKLPFAAQALALNGIFRLTMEEVGGLPNLLAILAKLSQDNLPESVKARLGSLTKHETQ